MCSCSVNFPNGISLNYSLFCRNCQAKPAKRRQSEPKPICTINPKIKKVSPKTKKAKSTTASKEK